MDGFEIREATLSEHEELARVNAIAFNEVSLARATQHEADWDTILAWWIGITKKRMQDERYRYFIAVDKTNNKIAGGAAICLAGDPPATSATATKPTWPKGMNAELGNFFFGPFLQNLYKKGYTETQHCRRAGMFLLPEYRGRGLAGILSEQCNILADEAGASTYVTAMPAAHKVLLKSGFHVLKTIDEQLKEYGGPDMMIRAYIMHRPVPDS